MAVVPEDTGYPMDWFKNKKSVRDVFECAVCLEVIKDPVQVRDCGHQFCRYCLDRVLGGLQAECPSCRKEISEEMVFTDNAANRTIGKLEVNCPSSRCEWDGSLNSLLEEHTARCPFFLLNCSNVGCDIQVTRQEFEEHLTQCEKRIVVCEHCKSEHVFKDKDEHLATCPLLPVECTNQCSEKNIPRNEMARHLALICLKSIIKCKYLEFGCEYECEREKMKEHLNQAVQEHLDLSTLEISRLKEKCNLQSLKHDKDVRGLETKFATKSLKHDKDVRELETKIAAKSLKHDKDVRELETKIAAKCILQSLKHDKDLRKLETKIATKSLLHDKDVRELETKIAAKYDTEIQELKAEISTKVTLTSPPMVITDVNRKFSEAKENNTEGDIDGDPFYTSPGGYKLKMLVRLNETTEKFKDHLGIYIHVMKSDYDAILSWPFKKKYTFTLVDQQDNEEERKNIAYTVTPAGQDCFNRPKNEENEGFGFACFVSHTTLRTRKYIKDDTVFITLSIGS